MKTVLNVKTDKNIKDRAQALAKHLGIPLSTVVNAQLKSFIESGEFKVTREPELRPSVIKELNQAIKEVCAGKNTSPRFATATDAIEWLHK
jgi:addiction module RelB/DinJ family antitoxin